MAADIVHEAKRRTPLPKSGDKTQDFTSKLLISELRKNQKLKRAIRVYNMCRGRTKKN